MKQCFVPWKRNHSGDFRDTKRHKGATLKSIPPKKLFETCYKEAGRKEKLTVIRITLESRHFSIIKLFTL